MPTDDIRRAIGRAGGLHTIQDLGNRWGVSRQRARTIVRMDGFPQPITTPGGIELWFGREADAFRNTPRRPGRPARQSQ